jgi:WD40 repeat protein
MGAMDDVKRPAETQSVPVRLVCGIPLDGFHAADGAELTVPASMGRKALRNIVHHLLGFTDEGDASAARPDLHFLVGKTEPLRTTLELYLERRGLSSETTLELTYYIPMPPPERPDPSSISNEWLSSIDVMRGHDGGAFLALVGSYSGAPSIVGASDCVVPECDLADGAHRAPIKAVAWLPTANAFVTAGHDAVAKIWSYSPEEKSASVCALFRSDDVTQEVLFETAAATLRADKQLVALGASDGSVWLLDDLADTLAAASAVAPAEASAKRKKTDVQEIGAQHIGSTSKDLTVTRVGWRNEELATAGLDGMLRFWDVDSSAVKVSVPGGGKALTAMCISDASCVVGCADGAVRLLDGRDGKGVVAVSLKGKGHAGIVSDVTWLSTDATMASGGLDGAVRVWDMRAFGAPVHIVNHVHGENARSLALCSGVVDQKRMLLSAGEDGHVQRMEFVLS